MKSIILAFLLIVCSAGKAEVKISLLTSTPGKQAHTVFGHSALRVINTDTDFDRMYNYGLFNFGTPFFPIRLLKGDLEYWLGRQTIPRFIEINNKEERTISEQHLNLNQNQAKRIFIFLEENAKSENKFYRYSFTQRNCATEIRDILLMQNLIGSRKQYSKTYRELINEYLDRHHWFKFGINMILGTKVEEEMSFEEQLFMPDNLAKAVAEAPGLVSKTDKLNADFAAGNFSIKDFILSPWVVFSLLTLLTIVWSPKWMRIVFYFVFGCLGLFVSYIWLSTLHPELTNNFNLLWCNPFYLLLILISIKKLNPKWMVIVLWTCLALVFVVWILGIQTFDHQIIPVVTLMSLLMFKEIKGFNDLKSQSSRTVMGA